MSSIHARVCSSMVPAVIGLPSLIGICPVRKMRSPARTALERESVRPLMITGPPMISLVVLGTERPPPSACVWNYYHT